MYNLSSPGMTSRDREMYIERRGEGTPPLECTFMLPGDSVLLSPTIQLVIQQLVFHSLP